MTLRLLANHDDTVVGSSSEMQYPSLDQAVAASPRQAGPAGLEYLSYATDILTEMRWMANRAGFPHLGELLLGALDEAESQRHRISSGNNP